MSTSTSASVSRIQVAAQPPIKVLITVRELDQGGIERDVAKIATHLDRSRFDPHVMAFWAHGFRYDELRAAGVPVIEIPVRSLASVETLRLAAKLRRYIRQHGFQIVHSYDASYVFACTVARLSGVPVTIGSQLSYLNTVDERTQMWLRLGSRVPNVMLGNCEAMRRYLVDDWRLRENRVEMIYNGVDTRQFYPPESRPKKASMIGIVCALRVEKNLLLLQQAFARIHSSHPELRLVIVGSGAELPKLLENAAKLGITDALDFVPATRDVPDWLRKMDIFVLPSYSEAFSNSMLEAMACGCAVVGSHVGGMPELTGRNEERGLLFPSGNADALAAQLERLITDDVLRHELGKKAAKFAKENLSIEIAAARTGSMYERLLAKKPGRT
jgi:glycosyltransferase involved in cell wall biosynthesis